nr:MAG TPA: hypothetical protein [Caudoviricetes sp.]
MRSISCFVYRKIERHFRPLQIGILSCNFLIA